MTTWTTSEVGLVMEAVLFRWEIRGVIRAPSPDAGPMQGYDVRFSFRRPPDTPGADTPMEWTPWMFLTAPELEQLADQMKHYMTTRGHLSPGETPPKSPN